MPKGQYTRKPSVELFMAKVRVLENGCWEWMGNTAHNGYGAVTVNKKPQRAHRFSYEYFRGPIPSGAILDHKCHPPTCLEGKNCPHRRCVNPEHLEISTIADNLKPDRSAPRGHYERTLLTHCKRGHEFSEDNTRIYRYKNKEIRSCRECERMHCRNHREEAKRAVTSSQTSSPLTENFSSPAALPPATDDQ